MHKENSVIIKVPVAERIDDICLVPKRHFFVIVVYQDTTLHKTDVDLMKLMIFGVCLLSFHSWFDKHRIHGYACPFVPTTSHPI